MKKKTNKTRERAARILDQIPTTASSKRYELPKSANEVVELAIERNRDDDSPHISITGLARALKKEFKIDASVNTISDRCKEMAGGTW